MGGVGKFVFYGKFENGEIQPFTGLIEQEAFFIKRMIIVYERL